MNLVVEQRMRADPNALPSNLTRCREHLAEAYEAWGKTEEAARWRENP